MIQCIIVDDDPLARKSLERLCLRQESLALAGAFERAADAISFLEETEDPVDLIFLDVEMPEMTGIEFLDRLTVMPMVIFTTSNPEYAFDAFEYKAIDFLKKPISIPRFDQAVAKALEISSKNQDYLSTSAGNSNELYIKEDGRYIRVNCDEILFFENVGDYIRIKTTTGQHIIHGTLKAIDDKLKDPRFLKVHRTYIVNLSKIKDIEEGTLVIDKTVIPISRAHRQELMSRLKIL
jgi:DNA-binding LytR/AlgR family response regulator